MDCFRHIAPDRERSQMVCLLRSNGLNRPDAVWAVHDPQQTSDALTGRKMPGIPTD